jgi:hypothetical protein
LINVEVVRRRTLLALHGITPAYRSIRISPLSLITNRPVGRLACPPASFAGASNGPTSVCCTPRNRSLEKTGLWPGV